jgi:hypothetical protein
MTTSKHWTTDQLTRLSLSLANGYCPGMMDTNPAQGHRGWTSRQLIRYSQDLTRGYGLGQ